MARVLPALIALLPAVWMLRASGALDALTALAAPLLERLGVPAETVPLMLLRKNPSTGQWFLNEIQCLADIRVPVAEDP